MMTAVRGLHSPACGQPCWSILPTSGHRGQLLSHRDEFQWLLPWYHRLSCFCKHWSLIYILQNGEGRSIFHFRSLLKESFYNLTKVPTPNESDFSKKSCSLQLSYREGQNCIIRFSLPFWQLEVDVLLSWFKNLFNPTNFIWITYKVTPGNFGRRQEVLHLDTTEVSVTHLWAPCASFHPPAWAQAAPSEGAGMIFISHLPQMWISLLVWSR